MTGAIAQIDTHATWGGGQYQVLALTRGLHARGVPVVLFARGDGELARRAQQAGLPVVGVPPVFASRWHPGGGHFLAQWCAERRVALLHAHDGRALTLAERAARRGRWPVIAARRIASPLRRDPISRLKYSPGRVAAIVATSRPVAAIVGATGFPEDRIHVVESATDQAALQATLPDEQLRRWADGRPLAGSAGRLVPKKNWALLLRAAAVLRDRGRDLRWVIAGDGPEREALCGLRRQLGLDDHVRLVTDGRNPEAVVKALDVMLHPARREGGAAILRVAMLARVPIVATTAPALVDALEGGGLTVDPDDATAAAEAVARVLEDGDVRARLVEDAFAVAQRRFGLDAMVQGTMRVYEAVLGSRGR